MGQKKDVSLALKSGYTIVHEGGVLVGDKTVLRASNPAGLTDVKLTLEGLKPGRTTLVLGYQRDEGTGRYGNRYNTTPVEVWVVDAQGVAPGGSYSSSGGGGCDSGFTGLALLLAGAFFLRRKS